MAKSRTKEIARQDSAYRHQRIIVKKENDKNV